MDRHPGAGHVAVTWKDYTIIWSGTCADPTFVNYHLHGEWVWQKTSGDLPENHYFATAVVIKDNMVVVGGGWRVNTNYVYMLDLKVWSWTKVTPGGIAPLMHTQGCSSWVYKNKMYCFGGEIYDHEGDLSSYPSYLEVSSDTEYTNQLFCYNITTNCWEWPNVDGEIPQPRAYHATIINSYTVFLFGGDMQINDLHILDMVSLRWKRVHGPGPDTSTLRVPNAREGHSLALISPSKAILFGGMFCYHSIPSYLRDCWLLDLDKAKGNQEISSIWKQIQSDSSEERTCHKALVEPVSQRLWLIGGNQCSKVETMTVNVVPLKVLAMECVVGKIRVDDPMLKASPKMLKKDIDTYRSSFDPVLCGPLQCGPYTGLPFPETSEGEDCDESDDEGLENSIADAALDLAASLLFCLVSYVPIKYF